LSFLAEAGAAVQTIEARSRGGVSTSGAAAIASASVVTCTQATGGQGGTFCYISSPGWTGLLSVGQSIGTNGAGTVTLSCNGAYSASGGGLSCAATIDDAICSPEQTISASNRQGVAVDGFAPIKSAAVVQCTRATGGQGGTQCYVQSPGFAGLVPVGSSVGTNGAGTVALSCNGVYSANGGGVNCTAEISQICP
jgi:hypothetical protein